MAVQNKHDIIAHWVEHIGIGFDPTCRSCDYDTPLEGNEAIKYDTEICWLWVVYGTMGELEEAILDEMTKQGLIP